MRPMADGPLAREEACLLEDAFGGAGAGGGDGDGDTSDDLLSELKTEPVDDADAAARFRLYESHSETVATVSFLISSHWRPTQNKLGRLLRSSSWVQPPSLLFGCRCERVSSISGEALKQTCPRARCGRRLRQACETSTPAKTSSSTSTLHFGLW